MLDAFVMAVCHVVQALSKKKKGIPVHRVNFSGPPGYGACTGTDWKNAFLLMEISFASPG